ncbi:MAG: PIN domain nuclease, partial [Anaerolineae bacterium]|nr:PIN domain nuclease [Anaerolineae bacterium]
MSIEFFTRLLGMVVFGILGARLGVDASPVFQLPPEAPGLIFSLIGTLFGLIVTPWITVRPARGARRFLLSTPTENVVMAFLGLVLGLIPATLLAYPLSLLPEPLGSTAPTILAAITGYLGMSLFGVRAHDVIELVESLVRGDRRIMRDAPAQEVLLDTSVIIDGRIQDIAGIGFLNWTLLVPRFVLEELQHIADSSEMLRRNRGKRGLEVLQELRNMEKALEVIDDDVPDIPEVDHKLVALARDRSIPIMTNDFNLNQIAKLQGV